MTGDTPIVLQNKVPAEEQKQKKMQSLQRDVCENIQYKD